MGSLTVYVSVPVSPFSCGNKARSSDMWSTSPASVLADNYRARTRQGHRSSTLIQLISDMLHLHAASVEVTLSLTWEDRASSWPRQPACCSRSATSRWPRFPRPNWPAAPPCCGRRSDGWRCSPSRPLVCKISVRSKRAGKRKKIREKIVWLMKRCANVQGRGS